MNRILIVGHPSSGYQEVEEILKQRGMASPLPSRREMLLPQDITATLCKAHQAPNISSVEAEDEIKPLQVAAVWHGMALDLMLGNLDQNLWGWSDPQSIYSLDYWRQLDDKLTFVLVYDAPQQALMNAALNNKDLSSKAIEHYINNWMAYNGALLAFFHRNRNRCLMVSSQQVKRNAEACLQQLQPLLSTPLLSIVESKLEKIDHVAATCENRYSIQESYPFLPAQKLMAIANLAGLDAKDTQSVLQGTTVEHYLLKQLLAEYPACQHLYAELQSTASLPLESDHRDKSNPGKAWGKMVQERLRNTELATGLYQAYLDMSNSLKVSLAEQTQEGEMLISHLHQVQEELENQYLKKEELRKLQLLESNKLKQQIAVTQKKQEEINILNKSLEDIKNQLVTAKTVQDEKTNKEQFKQVEILKQENDLLLTQMHLVQEELERYFLENQKLKQNQAPVYYGAAERIKQELSYRLGATMIKRSRSLVGWLGMPQALAAERRAWYIFNNEQSQKTLPPLDLYRDHQEAERVKNHLSYRLGQVLTRNGSSLIGWVKLPFALSREVRQFRIKRKEI